MPMQLRMVGPRTLDTGLRRPLCICFEADRLRDHMSRTLMEKFPIEGKVFETPTWNWAARVTNDPKPGSTLSPYPDMVLFEMEFSRTDSAPSEPRRLRLWTSKAGFCNEGDYQALLFDSVLKWLSSSQDISGEIWCFGNQ